MPSGVRAGRHVQPCLLLLVLGACSATPPGGAVTAGGIQLRPVPADQQVPDYAKKPYEPFGRENAIAVALREWRAWGMPVSDQPPGRDVPVSTRPDRQPGLWQRVGDYWWIGQNAVANGSSWSGKYGEFGTPYVGEPAAWSAAFISYVMRVAGAGDRFPYSALHATYINAAAQGNPVVQAQPPETYPVQAGDLICYGRRGAERLRLADLPAPNFYGHCDIVVGADPGMLTVIGGNVTAGVTMKHVPVTDTGALAYSDGRPADQRYPWFVALHVVYDDTAYSPVAVGLPRPLPPLPSQVEPVVTQPDEEVQPTPTAPVRPKPRAAPARRLRGRYR